jgi:hypothetical protein
LEAQKKARKKTARRIVIEEGKTRQAVNSETRCCHQTARREKIWGVPSFKSPFNLSRW